MKRWYEISKDPNAPDVKKFRKDELGVAKSRTLIPDRIHYFCELARDKDVLDIGIVEHTHEAIQNPYWLHKHVSNIANSCLGVDILKEEIDYLRSLGLNVLCADLIKEPLDQTFDVIICGEVLEHLEAPGYLLANITKMLRPNGKLVISVPNPWYINVILKSAFNGSAYIDNVDHVCWFDPCTICELGQRYGLVLDRFTGIEVQGGANWRTTLFFKLYPLFVKLGIRAELFAKTIIYEFKLAQ